MKKKDIVKIALPVVFIILLICLLAMKMARGYSHEKTEKGIVNGKNTTMENGKITYSNGKYTVTWSHIERDYSLINKAFAFRFLGGKMGIDMSSLNAYIFDVYDYEGIEDLKAYALMVPTRSSYKEAKYVDYLPVEHTYYENDEDLNRIFDMSEYFPGYEGIGVFYELTDYTPRSRKGISLAVKKGTKILLISVEGNVLNDYKHSPEALDLYGMEEDCAKDLIMVADDLLSGIDF